MKRIVNLKSAAALLAFSALTLTANAQSGEVPGLKATLSTRQAVYQSGQPIVLDVTLRNTTDRPLALLDWSTPLAGMRSSMFNVERDGIRVNYEGYLVRRLPATAEDFRVLGAGESVTCHLDLATGYNTIYQGHYTVALETFLHSGEGLAIEYPVAGPGVLISNRASFVVVDGPIAPAGRPAIRASGNAAAASGPSFTNCTDAQIECIKKAIEQAQKDAKAAKQCLQDGATADMNKWFGGSSEECIAMILDCLCKIIDGLGSDLEFDCAGPACQPGYIAYVNLSEPGKIYLCPAFFTLTVGGANSKADTLVHELSHLECGTDDFVYGCEDACWLAKNYPKYAKENADNFAYFVSKKSGGSDDATTLEELIAQLFERTQRTPVLAH